MEITGFISAIIVGLIIGVLGRLVAPGRQHVPLWLTLVIGIVAAFVGSAIAAIFTSFWLFVLIIQVVVAAIGVALVDRGFAGRRKG